MQPIVFRIDNGHYKLGTTIKIVAKYPRNPFTHTLYHKLEDNEIKNHTYVCSREARRAPTIGNNHGRNIKTAHGIVIWYCTLLFLVICHMLKYEYKYVVVK